MVKAWHVIVKFVTEIKMSYALVGDNNATIFGGGISIIVFFKPNESSAA